MKKADLLRILAGLVLVSAYLSLSNAVGFRSEQNQPFFYVGWKESYFWLAHFALAAPGLLLLSLGLAPYLGPALLDKARRIAEFAPHRWRMLALLFAVFLAVVSLLGRSHLLLGTTVTADELGVLFGGRMVAEGQLKVPTPQPRDSLPLYFVYERDGFVSSFDFPGSIFFSALSLVTKTGPAAYSILAALSGLALCWAASTMAGRKGALVAAAFWLCSPMAISLSYTTHAQLLSRSLGAIALAFYCHLVVKHQTSSFGSGIPSGFLLGLAGGLTFLCRPIEATCFLAPAALHLIWLSPTRRDLHWPVGIATLTWTTCAGFFAWYNSQITGAWYLQARFSAQFANKYSTDQTTLDLLGTNVGFNIMMLTVFFLGPLGLLLAYAGLGRNPVGIVLMSGVLLQLAVGLLHPDTGIHLVGPIHYSESAVPLTLLAVLGFRRLWRSPVGVRCSPKFAVAACVAYLAALISFNAVHSLTLLDQARNQRVLLDAVEDAKLENAVVIAEPPHRLWDLRPEFAEVRGWVATHPLPDPFLRDEVIFALPTLPVTVLADSFPDRDLYLMTYHAEGSPVRIRSLTER